MKVREKLEAIGAPMPMEVEEYKLLSSVAANVGPATKPQVYNQQKLPTLGGYYQEVGLLTALNELAWPLSLLGAAAGQLAPLEEGPSTEIGTAAWKLVRSVGGVRLKSFKTILGGAA